VRGLIEWADSVAWDVGVRREVIEDMGVVGRGGSLVAALWSEIGRMRRERGGKVEVKATGTGVVFEQQVENEDGTRADTKTLAVGVEPQVLSGEKRGPIGTASEPLTKRVREVVEDATGMDVDEVAGRVQSSDEGLDVDAREVERELGQGVQELRESVQGAVKEGRKRVGGFMRGVEERRKVEEGKAGWRSHAFDV